MTVPSSVDALVVYGSGAPTAVVFSWSGGTPIYVDSATGDIWGMVNNVVTKISAAKGTQQGAILATSINFGQTTLSYYGEGTWTPIDSSGAGLSFTSVLGYYTRIGRQVFCHYTLVYPATANGSTATIGGLPFTVANNSAARAGGNCTINVTTPSIYIQPIASANGTTFVWILVYSASAATNAQMTGSTQYGSCVYFV